METITSLSKALNVGYFVIVVLYLLDATMLLEIKSPLIKTTVTWAFLCLTPLVLVWNIVWNVIWLDKSRRRPTSLVLPSLMLVLILIANPVYILWWSSPWKTQTVLFQNNTFPFQTIEEQMQDKGAFGYNIRTVKATYITPWFMIPQKNYQIPDSSENWEQVNDYVNEMGLKGS